MKLAFVGIGGLGAFFGGRLTKYGNDVVFIARGAMLQALRNNGLRVESALGDFTLPEVNATDDPAQAGQPDAIFVTTKTWQVPEAAKHIRPMVGPNTTVVPLQNGVEAYGQLAVELGADHVIGGLCHVMAFVTAPGAVKQMGFTPIVTLGEWNNQRSPRVERLIECMKTAGFDARIPDDIRVALWEKFMFIATFGGVGGVTRAPIGIMRTVPQVRTLLQRSLEEIMNVARAHGVAVPDRSVQEALKFIDSLPVNGTASMQRDVMAGRPSELEAMSGAIVRLGKAKATATPVHDFLYSALLPGELRSRGEVSF